MVPLVHLVQRAVGLDRLRVRLRDGQALVELEKLTQAHLGVAAVAAAASAAAASGVAQGCLVGGMHLWYIYI